jgi:hypothetical protein
MPTGECMADVSRAEGARPASRRAVMATALALAGMSACTPTIRFAAPSEPITINLNVKIDQEVRVRLDKEIEDLIANNPDAF